MRATPFLMFQDGRAEAALNLYVSLFPDAQITSVQRYGPEGPGAEGTILQARFELAGLSIMCIDSPVAHQFNFTPSFSFFIDCDDEEQLERLHSQLSDGGESLMPLGSYGFSQKFAWLNDRFGISWQLNLP